MQTLKTLASVDKRNPLTLADLAADMLTDIETDRAFRMLATLANGCNVETVRTRLTALVEHFSACFEALNVANLHVDSTLSEFATGSADAKRGQSFRAFADWMLNDPSFSTIRPNAEKANDRRKRIKGSSASVHSALSRSYATTKTTPKTTPKTRKSA